MTLKSTVKHFQVNSLLLALRCWYTKHIKQEPGSPDGLIVKVPHHINTTTLVHFLPGTFWSLHSLSFFPVYNYSRQHAWKKNEKTKSSVRSQEKSSQPRNKCAIILHTGHTSPLCSIKREEGVILFKCHQSKHPEAQCSQEHGFTMKTWGVFPAVRVKLPDYQCSDLISSQ